MQKFNPNFYLTADDAAKELGISLSTLYAYVSRGLIKSQSLESSRKKGYLTKITEEGPVYRGVAALTLARTENAESIASLLWQKDLSLFETETRFLTTQKFKALRKNFVTLNPLAQYVSLAATIEQEFPKSYNLTPDGAAKTSVDVIRLLASFIVGKNYPKNTPLHQFIASKNNLSEGYTELLRAFFVLAADHEQGPALQIARNSAYAGNTPYGVVSAALIGWQGSYMMKGIGQPLMQFMTEIMGASNPARAITKRLQDGAPLPGIGSPVYGARDPRGAFLIQLAEEYLPDDREVQKFCLVAEMIEDITGKTPSLVVMAAFLAWKLNIPNQLRALIASARCIGWLAHALEVYDENSPFAFQNHKMKT